MGPPRTAAGSLGLPRKSHRNDTAVHGAQAVTNLFGCGNPLAGGDGVLDARQLLDETPAAGNHERIVTDVAGRRLDDPPAVTQARHLRGHVHHLHAPKEVRQGHYQLFAPAQARGNPDGAGKIVQLRARRDHGDLDFRIAAADFKHAGERAEAGADDGNAGGWIHERRLLVGRGLQGAISGGRMVLQGRGHRP
jgi:hypothetical protein